MKILFISFYFPPYSVSTPATRAVEFIKYLKEFGIEPVVLSQEGFIFGRKDRSFDKDIKDIPVYRVKMPKFERRYDKKTPFSGFLRNMAWPDGMFLFVIRGLPLALKLIKKYKIDFVFCFSPPFSSIFLTYLIHKRVGVPYAIDLQDPWKEDLYNIYRNRLQQSLTFYYERRILKKARFLTTINMPMTSLYRSEYGHKNVYFLPFGYRREDILNIKEIKRGEKLRFLYAGTLGGTYKNPYPLFEAIDLFFSKHYGAKVEFYFVGNKTLDVIKRLSKFPQDEVISIPYVEKKDISKLVNKAHALILLSSKGRHSNLVSTSKVYELINLKRPLVAFLDLGWVYDFVERYTPFITKWDDVVGMANIFEKLYELWKDNELTKYALSPKKEYSYYFLAKTLYDIIREHSYDLG